MYTLSFPFVSFHSLKRINDVYLFFPGISLCVGSIQKNQKQNDPLLPPKYFFEHLNFKTSIIYQSLLNMIQNPCYPIYKMHHAC
jgi:hypothetical protein